MGNLMNFVTTYSQGEELQLSCLSEGGPELEYTWLFSGNVIANTSTLTIDNVNTSHGGEYTCNVTNDAGYDSDTVTVYSELFVDQFTSCILLPYGCDIS